MGDRYFLRSKLIDPKWKEVSQVAFVKAERAAGFHPKGRAGPLDCATGGFGGNGLEGLVTSEEHFRPEWYDKRPEIVEAMAQPNPFPISTQSIAWTSDDGIPCVADVAVLGIGEKAEVVALYTYLVGQVPHKVVPGSKEYNNDISFLTFALHDKRSTVDVTSP